MRSKVVLSAMGLALLILAPALYFHFKPSAPPSDQAATPAPPQMAAIPAVAPAAVPHHRTIAPVNGGEGVQALNTEDDTVDNHKNVIAERAEQLNELGMSTDPSDLKTILANLNDKDPNIRSAALSAVQQFGSKDAIPSLNYAMQSTEDPEEKVAIMKAINYLQLPSYDEVQASLAASAPQPPADQPPPAN